MTKLGTFQKTGCINKLEIWYLNLQEYIYFKFMSLMFFKESALVLSQERSIIFLTCVCTCCMVIRHSGNFTFYTFKRQKEKYFNTET